MREKDTLKLTQLERQLAPFRALVDVRPPRAGWIRALREALGMSSRQLARRLELKAAQSIEDMQRDEAAGTIKLQTLSKIAEALNCQLVYALVPRKPFSEIMRDRAAAVAAAQLDPVLYSMELEMQGVSDEAKRSAFNRRVDRLLAGSRRKLWE